MTNTVSRTVPDETLNAIMYIESAGNPNAKARTSTASGLGQFLKATWRDTVKKHRPNVFANYSDSDLLALRFNPSFAIEMLARFTEDNLRLVGANASPGDLYLAHFLGAGDAKKIYRADPERPVSSLLASGPIKANPSILRGKTAGDVRKWAASKMDGASRRAGDYVRKFYKGNFAMPGTEMSSRNRIDVETVAEEMRPGLKSGGDARLYDNQAQLKSMNYNPGGLDGVWGGGTSGAIAAFLNDYNPNIAVPTSWKAYDQNYSAIDAVIDEAEAERFRRPVTEEREDADPDTVERVAQEIIPAKRNLWTIVSGFFAALGSTVYKGFEWLMGYQDEAERFGVMNYIDKVPTFVWLGLGTAAVGAAVFFAIRTVKGIEKPVTTGERM